LISTTRAPNQRWAAGCTESESQRSSTETSGQASVAGRNPYASREPYVTGSLGGSGQVAHQHKPHDKVNEEDEFEDE
jgi:hypothetical protein